jgi:subtilase family serine protease
MNSKTGGNRGPRRAAALATVAAIAALTAACSGSPSSSAGSASTESPIYRANLAYAQCMRAHGLQNFPNPSPSPGFSFSGQPGGNGSGPAVRANDACKYLLPGGSAGTGGATAPATASPPGAVAADCLTSQPPCYAPRQLRVAYGIQPLLDRGITGRGVTVVLPEEAETGPGQPPAVTGEPPTVTDILQDLADFYCRFGLPPAQIHVITTLAGSSASPRLAGLEEVLDTEMVHAVAPDATIRELLVDPADVSTPAKLAATFATYVRIAVGQHADVISQSGIGQDFNVGEGSFTSAAVVTMNSALEYAAA